jgi:hypothetical protein
METSVLRLSYLCTSILKINDLFAEGPATVIWRLYETSGRGQLPFKLQTDVLK